MDDLAKKTGLSKKTLYRHFIDKNELVNEVADYLIDCHLQTFMRCANDSKDAVEELLMQSDLAFSSLPNVNVPFFFDLQKYYPQVWDKIVTYKNSFLLPCLEENLQRGMEEELFRKEIDVAFTAEIRFQHINALIRQEDFLSHANRPVQLQQDLTLFYLQGITTSKGKNLINQYLKNKNEK